MQRWYPRKVLPQIPGGTFVIASKRDSCRYFLLRAILVASLSNKNPLKIYWAHAMSTLFLDLAFTLGWRILASLIRKLVATAIKGYVWRGRSYNGSIQFFSLKCWSVVDLWAGVYPCQVLAVLCSHLCLLSPTVPLQCLCWVFCWMFRYYWNRYKSCPVILNRNFTFPETYLFMLFKYVNCRCRSEW